MTVQHSRHLDLIRFSAAVMVFLDHLHWSPFTENTVPSYLGRFGAIGVAVFFVLSGYVIAFVTSTRERTLAAYTTARISRLYSVVPLALAMTLIFDWIGMSLDPQFYSIPKVLSKPPSIEGYISSFFFVNDWQIWGFHGISPGTNNPL